MKVALVNPHWDFARSIYFGWRSPRLPLELGYCKALLEADGHEVLLVDGHLSNTENDALADAVADSAPGLTVVTTAPSYLSWRGAQPEPGAPHEVLARLGRQGGRTAAVGPHGFMTPEATPRKLDIDVVVRGECEEAVLLQAEAESLAAVPSIGFLDDAAVRITGGPRSARFTDLPAQRWPAARIVRHHHCIDCKPERPGAAVEASHGCPIAAPSAPTR